MNGKKVEVEIVGLALPCATICIQREAKDWLILNTWDSLMYTKISLHDVHQVATALAGIKPTTSGIGSGHYHPCY